MPEKIHGASSSCETLSSNLQYYVVYTSSPNAFSDLENATGVNIKVTGNYKDLSQKNFEVLLQSVGLRAMPVIMTDPQIVQSLEVAGAPTLIGEGFVWKFAIEREDVFKNIGPLGTISEVGFLIDELHGIVLPSSVVIDTKNTKNIEFDFREFL